MSSDTFSSWFRSFASCCGSRERPRSGESRLTGAERNIVVLRDQPAVIPQPSAAPAWSSEETYEKTLERERETAKLQRRGSRDSSARPNWFSGSSSSVRRLQISGPTDFRHLQSESFQFPPQKPPPQSRPRPRSFRPIELSIYQPHNRLSAILPHIECDITPPPPAHTANSSRWDGSSGTTAHDRSHSTMSFHLPRKGVRQESGSSDPGSSPPRIPPKSRARASTAPNTVRIVERIASAILEKERLQAEINMLIQRQSVYLGSRPSTGYDMRGLEPMPSIPALPAAAPSFAERLSVDDRPRTAPSHMHSMTVQEKTLKLTAAAQPQSQSQSPRSNFTSPHHGSSSQSNFTPPRHGSSSESEQLERPLAPPLPLVLRPPLRKKKSFSRVSNWLFQPEDPNSGESSAEQSPTMVFTTSPRPVKESDGFYQCVAPPEGLPRTSMETSSSVYTWGTGDSADSAEEAKTVPTTAAAWSPEQTPKQGSRHTTPVIGAGNGKGVFGEETASTTEAVWTPEQTPSSKQRSRHTTPVTGAGNGVFEKETAPGSGAGLVAEHPEGHRPLSVGVAF